MAAHWPATLPQFFDVGGYGHKPANNTLRTTTISGRMRARRRSRKKQRAFQARFEMDATQLATFEGFWMTTLGEGSLPFQQLNHPVTGANTVWHPMDDYSVSAAGGQHFLVSLPLLALPDAPA